MTSDCLPSIKLSCWWRLQPRIIIFSVSVSLNNRSLIAWHFSDNSWVLTLFCEGLKEMGKFKLKVSFKRYLSKHHLGSIWSPDSNGGQNCERFFLPPKLLINQLPMRVALVTITEPVLSKFCFGAVIDSLSKLAQVQISWKGRIKTNTKWSLYWCVYDRKAWYILHLRCKIVR